MHQPLRAEAPVERVRPPTAVPPTAVSPTAVSPTTVSPAGDDGMATAEYAVATLAACAFAGLLLTIVRSDQVRELLFGIIQRALALT